MTVTDRILCGPCRAGDHAQCRAEEAIALLATSKQDGPLWAAVDELLAVSLTPPFLHACECLCEPHYRTPPHETYDPPARAPLPAGSVNAR